jgi:hypothetical protein
MKPAKLATVILAFLLAAIAFTAAHAADPSSPPSIRIKEIVEGQLGKFPNYLPGDMISRNQVLPVFDELKRSGWIVSDQAEILSQILPENDWLIQEFRTPAGRTFMRQIVGYPMAYDRVDRLSNMIMGHQNVEALVAGPDGFKMIQYMTMTPYGKNLGNQLSNAPNGTDFNGATGKIYTADDLITRLNQSYERAVQSWRAATGNAQ